MQKKEQTGVTPQELKADAVALQNKIKEVPGWDKNVNLLYAHREAGNLISWLSK